MFKTKLLGWLAKAAGAVSGWVNFTRVVALTILVSFSLTSIASGYTDYEKREMDKNNAQAVTPVGSASTNMNEMYHTGGMQTYKDGDNTYFMKNGQVQKIEHGSGEKVVTETIDRTDPKKDIHKFYNINGEEVKDEKGTSISDSSSKASNNNSTINREIVKESIKDSVKQIKQKENQQTFSTSKETSQENKKSEASTMQSGKTSQNAVVSAKVDTRKESLSNIKNNNGDKSTRTKNKIDDTSGVSKEGLSEQTGGINSLIDKAKSITTQMFANIVNLVSGENKKSDATSAEVSVADIQKIAKDNGVALNAIKTDYEGLKEAVKSSPAIVHLKPETSTSKGSFIVVTAADDSQITYIGSNGKARASVSQSEFNQKWDGKVLTSKKEGSDLSISEKKNTKGTFVSKVLGSIKEVFSQKTDTKNMSSFLSAYSSATPAQKEKLASKYGVTAKQVEKMMDAFVNEYKNASSTKKAEMAKYAGVSGQTLETIYKQTSAQVASAKSKPETAIKAKIAAISDANTSAQTTQATQNAATTVQTQTTTTAATTAVSSITTFLNEYVSATPERQAEMAATLGLTSNQLVGLTVNSANQIINYLKEQGSNIINCAVNSLSQMFSVSGKTVDSSLLARQTLLVDILTGNLDTSNSSAQVQTSAFAIQQTAKINGVALSGYNTTTTGLDQALSSGSSAIINLNLGGGTGHYVTLTSGANGTYSSSDGNTYKISADNSVSYTNASGATKSATWTGNLLTQSAVTSAGTKVLSSAELKTVKGSQTVEEANASVSSAQNEVTAAQNTLTSAQTNITAAQAMQTAAQAVVVAAQNEVTTSQAEVTAAQTAVTVAQAAVVAAQNEVMAAQNAVNVAQAAVVAAQNEVAIAQNAVSVAQNAVSSAQGAVSSAQNAVSSAQNAVNAAQSRVSSAQGGVNSAQSALNSARSRANGAGHVGANATQEEKDAAARDRAGADADVRDCEARLAQAQDQLRAAQEELRAAQERLRQAQEQLRQAQERLRQAQEQLRAAQERLKTAQEKLKQAQEKLKQAQEKLKQAQEKLKQAQEKLKQAQEKLKQAQEKLKQAQQKLKYAQEILKQAQQKLKQAQDKLSLAKDKLKAAQDKLKAAQDGARSVLATYHSLVNAGVKPKDAIKMTYDIDLANNGTAQEKSAANEDLIRYMGCDRYYNNNAVKDAIKSNTTNAEVKKSAERMTIAQAGGISGDDAVSLSTNLSRSEDSTLTDDQRRDATNGVTDSLASIAASEPTGDPTTNAASSSVTTYGAKFNAALSMTATSTNQDVLIGAYRMGYLISNGASIEDATAVTKDLYQSEDMTLTEDQRLEGTQAYISLLGTIGAYNPPDTGAKGGGGKHITMSALGVNRDTVTGSSILGLASAVSAYFANPAAHPVSSSIDAVCSVGGASTNDDVVLSTTRYVTSVNGGEKSKDAALLSGELLKSDKGDAVATAWVNDNYVYNAYANKGSLAAVATSKNTVVSTNMEGRSDYFYNKFTAAEAAGVGGDQYTELWLEASVNTESYQNGVAVANGARTAYLAGAIGVSASDISNLTPEEAKKMSDSVSDYHISNETKQIALGIAGPNGNVNQTASQLVLASYFTGGSTRTGDLAGTKITTAAMDGIANKNGVTSQVIAPAGFTVDAKGVTNISAYKQDDDSGFFGGFLGGVGDFIDHQLNNINSLLKSIYQPIIDMVKATVQAAIQGLKALLHGDINGVVGAVKDIAQAGLRCLWQVVMCNAIGAKITGMFSAKFWGRMLGPLEWFGVISVDDLFGKTTDKYGDKHSWFKDNQAEIAVQSGAFWGSGIGKIVYAVIAIVITVVLTIVSFGSATAVTIALLFTLQGLMYLAMLAASMFLLTLMTTYAVTRDLGKSIKAGLVAGAAAVITAFAAGAAGGAFSWAGGGAGSIGGNIAGYIAYGGVMGAAGVATSAVGQWATTGKVDWGKALETGAIAGIAGALGKGMASSGWGQSASSWLSGATGMSGTWSNAISNGIMAGGVNALTDISTQLIVTGKVDWNQTAQGAAIAFGAGAAMSLVGGYLVNKIGGFNSGNIMTNNVVTSGLGGGAVGTPMTSMDMTNMILNTSNKIIANAEMFNTLLNNIEQKEYNDLSAKNKTVGLNDDEVTRMQYLQGAIQSNFSFTQNLMPWKAGISIAQTLSSMATVGQSVTTTDDNGVKTTTNYSAAGYNTNGDGGTSTGLMSNAFTANSMASNFKSLLGEKLSTTDTVLTSMGSIVNSMSQTEAAAGSAATGAGFSTVSNIVSGVSTIIQTVREAQIRYNATNADGTKTFGGKKVSQLDSAQTTQLMEMCSQDSTYTIAGAVGSAAGAITNSISFSNAIKTNINSVPGDKGSAVSGTNYFTMLSVAATSLAGINASATSLIGNIDRDKDMLDTAATITSVGSAVSSNFKISADISKAESEVQIIKAGTLYAQNDKEGAKDILSKQYGRTVTDIQCNAETGQITQVVVSMVSTDANGHLMYNPAEIRSVNTDGVPVTLTNVQSAVLSLNQTVQDGQVTSVTYSVGQYKLNNNSNNNSFIEFTGGSVLTTTGGNAASVSILSDGGAVTESNFSSVTVDGNGVVLNATGAGLKVNGIAAIDSKTGKLSGDATVAFGGAGIVVDGTKKIAYVLTTQNGKAEVSVVNYTNDNSVKYFDGIATSVVAVNGSSEITYTSDGANTTAVYDKSGNGTWHNTSGTAQLSGRTLAVDANTGTFLLQSSDGSWASLNSKETFTGVESLFRSDGKRDSKATITFSVSEDGKSINGKEESNNSVIKYSIFSSGISSGLSSLGINGFGITGPVLLSYNPITDKTSGKLIGQSTSVTSIANGTNGNTLMQITDYTAGENNGHSSCQVYGTLNPDGKYDFNGKTYSPVEMAQLANGGATINTAVKNPKLMSVSVSQEAHTSDGKLVSMVYNIFNAVDNVLAGTATAATLANMASPVTAGELARNQESVNPNNVTGVINEVITQVLKNRNANVSNITQFDLSSEEIAKGHVAVNVTGISDNGSTLHSSIGDIQIPTNSSGAWLSVSVIDSNGNAFASISASGTGISSKVDVTYRTGGTGVEQITTTRFGSTGITAGNSVESTTVLTLNNDGSANTTITFAHNGVTSQSGYTCEKGGAGTQLSYVIGANGSMVENTMKLTANATVASNVGRVINSEGKATTIVNTIESDSAGKLSNESFARFADGTPQHLLSARNAGTQTIYLDSYNATQQQESPSVELYTFNNNTRSLSSISADVVFNSKTNQYDFVDVSGGKKDFIIDEVVGKTKVASYKLSLNTTSDNKIQLGSTVTAINLSGKGDYCKPCSDLSNQFGIGSNIVAIGGTAYTRKDNNWVSIGSEVEGSIAGSDVTYHLSKKGDETILKGSAKVVDASIKQDKIVNGTDGSLTVDYTGKIRIKIICNNLTGSMSQSITTNAATVGKLVDSSGVAKNVTLQAGANLSYNQQNGTFGVISGEVDNSESIYLAVGTPGAGGTISDVKTKGVIKAEINDGKITGHTIDAGATISIRSGQLTLQGNGTEYLAGSILDNGQRVLAEGETDGYGNISKGISIKSVLVGNELRFVSGNSYVQAMSVLVLDTKGSGTASQYKIYGNNGITSAYEIHTGGVGFNGLKASNNSAYKIDLFVNTATGDIYFNTYKDGKVVLGDDGKPKQTLRTKSITTLTNYVESTAYNSTESRSAEFLSKESAGNDNFSLSSKLAAFADKQNGVNGSKKTTNNEEFAINRKIEIEKGYTISYTYSATGESTVTSNNKAYSDKYFYCGKDISSWVVGGGNINGKQGSAIVWGGNDTINTAAILLEQNPLLISVYKKGQVLFLTDTGGIGSGNITTLKGETVLQTANSKITFYCNKQDVLMVANFVTTVPAEMGGGTLTYARYGLDDKGNLDSPVSIEGHGIKLSGEAPQDIYFTLNKEKGGYSAFKTPADAAQYATLENAIKDSKNNLSSSLASVVNPGTVMTTFGSVPIYQSAKKTEQLKINVVEGSSLKTNVQAAMNFLENNGVKFKLSVNVEEESKTVTLFGLTPKEKNQSLFTNQGINFGAINAIVGNIGDLSSYGADFVMNGLVKPAGGASGESHSFIPGDWGQNIIKGSADQSGNWSFTGKNGVLVSIPWSETVTGEHEGALNIYGFQENTQLEITRTTTVGLTVQGINKTDNIISTDKLETEIGTVSTIGEGSKLTMEAGAKLQFHHNGDQIYDGIDTSTGNIFWYQSIKTISNDGKYSYTCVRNVGYGSNKGVVNVISVKGGLISDKSNNGVTIFGAGKRGDLGSGRYIDFSDASLSVERGFWRGTREGFAGTGSAIIAAVLFYVGLAGSKTAENTAAEFRDQTYSLIRGREMNYNDASGVDHALVAVEVVLDLLIVGKVIKMITSVASGGLKLFTSGGRMVLTNMLADAELGLAEGATQTLAKSATRFGTWLATDVVTSLEAGSLRSLLFNQGLRILAAAGAEGVIGGATMATAGYITRGFVTGDWSASWQIGRDLVSGFAFSAFLSLGVRGYGLARLSNAEARSSVLAKISKTSALAERQGAQVASTVEKTTLNTVRDFLRVRVNAVKYWVTNAGENMSLLALNGSRMLTVSGVLGMGVSSLFFTPIELLIKGDLFNVYREEGVAGIFHRIGLGSASFLEMSLTINPLMGVAQAPVKFFRMMFGDGAFTRAMDVFAASGHNWSGIGKGILAGADREYAANFFKLAAKETAGLAENKVSTSMFGRIVSAPLSKETWSVIGKTTGNMLLGQVGSSSFIAPALAVMGSIGTTAALLFGASKEQAEYFGQKFAFYSLIFLPRASNSAAELSEFYNRKVLSTNAKRAVSVLDSAGVPESLSIARDINNAESGSELTFTAKNGKKYTLTSDDIDALRSVATVRLGKHLADSENASDVSDIIIRGQNEIATNPDATIDFKTGVKDIFGKEEIVFKIGRDQIARLKSSVDSTIVDLYLSREGASASDFVKGNPSVKGQRSTGPIRLNDTIEIITTKGETVKVKVNSGVYSRMIDLFYKSEADAAKLGKLAGTDSERKSISDEANNAEQNLSRDPRFKNGTLDNSATKEYYRLRSLQNIMEGAKRQYDVLIKRAALEILSNNKLMDILLSGPIEEDVFPIEIEGVKCSFDKASLMESLAEAIQYARENPAIVDAIGKNLLRKMEIVKTSDLEKGNQNAVSVEVQSAGFSDALGKLTKLPGESDISFAARKAVLEIKIIALDYQSEIIAKDLLGQVSDSNLTVKMIDSNIQLLGKKDGLAKSIVDLRNDNIKRITDILKSRVEDIIKQVTETKTLEDVIRETEDGPQKEIAKIILILENLQAGTEVNSVDKDTVAGRIISAGRELLTFNNKKVADIIIAKGKKSNEENNSETSSIVDESIKGLSNGVKFFNADKLSVSEVLKSLWADTAKSAAREIKLIEEFKTAFIACDIGTEAELETMINGKDEEAMRGASRAWLNKIRVKYFDTNIEKSFANEKVRKMLKELLDVPENDFTDAQAKRNAISEIIFNGKAESELSIMEKFALNLALIREYGANLKEYDAKVKKNWFEGSPEEMNEQFFVKNAIGESAKIINQTTMVIESLFGRISSLKTAAGKSYVYWLTASLRAHMTGKEQLCEIIAARDSDASGLLINDNAKLTRALGLELVKANKYYDNTANGPKNLAEQYSNPLDDKGPIKARIIIHDLTTRGFVELTARSSSEVLNNALNLVNIRMIDEADVAALSKVAFIQGSGKDFASKKLVNSVESLINELGKLTYVDIGKFESGEYQTDDKRSEIDGYYYTTKDGSSPIYSKALQDKINSLVERAGKNGDNVKAQISQIIRARNIFEHPESAQFKNGQTSSVESGVGQENTTDNSASYNIAAVIYKMRLIDGKSLHDADGTKNTVTDEDGQVFNKYNIKLSKSSGEATISQMFSRGIGETINAGGSATIDVAKEIAQAIFGSTAVEVEGSSLSTRVTLGKSFSAQILDRDGIISSTADYLFDALTNKTNTTLAKHGELIGSVDVSYNKDVLRSLMAKMLGGKITEIEDIINKDKPLGDILADIKNNDFVKTKSIDGKSVSDILAKIDAIDSKMAENNAKGISDIAKAAKGRVVFSNEAGLRGINFQYVNVRLLDGHNFSEGDLLQALGRAGRDVGDSDFTQTVYMEKSSLKRNLVDAHLADLFTRGNQNNRDIFADPQGVKDKGVKDGRDISKLLALHSENQLSEDTPGNAVELLALSSRYKSLSAKSESIIFKATNEAAYILMTQPIVDMLADARIKGNKTAERILNEAYLRIIEHTEQDIARSIDTNKGFETGEEVIKRIYENAAKRAQVELAKVRNELSGVKGSDAYITDLNIRIVDISGTKIDSYFKNPAGKEGITFAFSNRNIRAGSVAEDVANVLAGLSKFVLPSRSGKVDNMIVKTTNVVETKSKLTDALKRRDANLSDAAASAEADGILRTYGIAQSGQMRPSQLVMANIMLRVYGYSANGNIMSKEDQEKQEAALNALKGALSIGTPLSDSLTINNMFNGYESFDDMVALGQLSLNGAINITDANFATIKEKYKANGVAGLVESLSKNYKSENAFGFAQIKKMETLRNLQKQATNSGMLNQTYGWRNIFNLHNKIITGTKMIYYGLRAMSAKKQVEKALTQRGNVKEENVISNIVLLGGAYNQTKGTYSFGNTVDGYKAQRLASNIAQQSSLYGKNIFVNATYKDLMDVNLGKQTELGLRTSLSGSFATQSLVNFTKRAVASGVGIILSAGSVILFGGGLATIAIAGIMGFVMPVDSKAQIGKGSMAKFANSMAKVSNFRNKMVDGLFNLAIPKTAPIAYAYGKALQNATAGNIRTLKGIEQVLKDAGIKGDVNTKLALAMLGKNNEEIENIFKNSADTAHNNYSQWLTVDQLASPTFDALKLYAANKKVIETVFVEVSNVNQALAENNSANVQKAQKAHRAIQIGRVAKFAKQSGMTTELVLSILYPKLSAQQIKDGVKNYNAMLALQNKKAYSRILKFASTLSIDDILVSEVYDGKQGVFGLDRVSELNYANFVRGLDIQEAAIVILKRHDVKIGRLAMPVLKELAGMLKVGNKPVSVSELIIAFADKARFDVIMQNYNKARLEKGVVYADKLQLIALLETETVVGTSVAKAPQTPVQQEAVVVAETPVTPVVEATPVVPVVAQEVKPTVIVLTPEMMGQVAPGIVSMLMGEKINIILPNTTHKPAKQTGKTTGESIVNYVLNVEEIQPQTTLNIDNTATYVINAVPNDNSKPTRTFNVKAQYEPIGAGIHAAAYIITDTATGKKLVVKMSESGMASTVAKADYNDQELLSSNLIAKATVSKDGSYVVQDYVQTAAEAFAQAMKNGNDAKAMAIFNASYKLLQDLAAKGYVYQNSKSTIFANIGINDNGEAIVLDVPNIAKVSETAVKSGEVITRDRLLKDIVTEIRTQIEYGQADGVNIDVLKLIGSVVHENSGLNIPEITRSVVNLATIKGVSLGLVEVDALVTTALSFAKIAEESAAQSAFESVANKAAIEIIPEVSTRVDTEINAGTPFAVDGVAGCVTYPSNNPSFEFVLAPMPEGFNGGIEAFRSSMEKTINRGRQILGQDALRVAVNNATIKDKYVLLTVEKGTSITLASATQEQKKMILEINKKLWASHTAVNLNSDYVEVTRKDGERVIVLRDVTAINDIKINGNETIADIAKGVLGNNISTLGSERTIVGEFANAVALGRNPQLDPTGIVNLLIKRVKQDKQGLDNIEELTKMLQQAA